MRVGRTEVRIEDVADIARGRCKVSLDPSPELRAKVEGARSALIRRLDDGKPVYGVTTGVGASVTNMIPGEQRSTMPHNLFRFHGCGTGEILAPDAAAAVVLIRLLTLAKGRSGVRWQVIERLADFLALRLLPQIPAEGSVGASGDLTPLSYLAAALCGEREVTLGGEPMSSAQAHRECNLAPLDLQPKESLSLMNGTSVMTALSCLAHKDSLRLSRLSAAITAMIVDVTHGNQEHYDGRLLAAKPHPGQLRCGSWIRNDLARSNRSTPSSARLQDRYSLRCAPHVIGSLLDALGHARDVLEIEVNGVDDNPIITDEGAVLHGGNFYGGHACMAADLLKVQVANLADLLDRQLVLLCSPETSDGLPANLVASEDVVHHGFKAMQISASALCAEALKLTVPASVFSRSTESHNQDKVSMGTIAARDLLRITELTETVAAITLLAACQAVDLRGIDTCGARGQELHTALRREISMVTEDRRQDRDIARVLEMLRADRLPIGDL